MPPIPSLTPSPSMLTGAVKATIQDAAQKLTGSDKRDFMAKVTEDYLGGSARQAETVFGWNRHSVELGFQERRSGIVCVGAYRLRGQRNSEETMPNLEADLRSVVEAHTQADPKFKSTLAYTRMSARVVRQALIDQKGYKDEQLPSRQTIGAILNRLGYRLKKPQKPSP